MFAELWVCHVQYELKEGRGGAECSREASAASGGGQGVGGFQLEPVHRSTGYLKVDGHEGVWSWAFRTLKMASWL